MTATALKLATPPPQDDRGALRLAIQVAEAAGAAFRENKQAEERADDLAYGAKEEIESLTAAVEAARVEEGGDIIAAIKAKSTTPVVGKVRSARAALLDAEDRRESALAAAKALEAEGKILGAKSGDASEAVHAAVNLLLEPTAERLLEEAMQARVKLWTCMAVLEELTSEPPLQFIGQRWIDRAEATRQRIVAFANYVASSRLPDSETTEVRERWREARKALRSDPNAALPDLP